MDIIKAIKSVKNRFRFHIPSKADLVHRGEHGFHSLYLGAESFLGHGILQYLAAATLVFIVLSIFVKEAHV